jgi:3-hydroxyisobutyrate dehydrogenase-like beta-hydroxyacid dehydrogenase
MKSAIGFIGIGTMGKAMSQHLIKAGYQVVVNDVRKESMDALVKVGATKDESPRKVAEQCRVVITMLPSSNEVEAVVLGPNGVIEGAKSGDLLIDMGSSYPGSTKMVSEKLAARGIRMIDAPVSGGEKGAIDATLSIMVGGNESDFNESHPILEAMGKNLYYVGPISAGHTVKALNNLCSAAALLITSEAMVIATKMGLDPVKVNAAINTSSGRSWATENKFPNQILSGKFASGFTIGLMNKDVGIANRLGRELHQPMYMGTMVEQMYNFAVGQGKSAECHTSVIKFMEDWAGVKVRAKGV